MKLTRKKLMQLIESSLIQTSGNAASATMLVSDPRNLYVFVDTSDRSFITITIGTSEDTHLIGSIEIEPVTGCANTVYTVNDVTAQEGYGPLLYDLGIFYASRYGWGLVATTLMSTNNESQPIWKHYYNRRRNEFDTYSLYDLCPNAPLPRTDTKRRIQPGNPLYLPLTTVYNGNKDKSLIRFLRQYNKIVKYKHYLD